MRHLAVACGLAAGLFASGSVSNAALLMYEPFADFSAWSSVPSAWSIDTASLDYNNGGPLVTSNDKARKVAGASGDFLRRTTGLSVSDGNSYWVSLLMKVDVSPSANREFGFMTTSFGANRVFFNWDPVSGTGGLLNLGTRDAAADPADGNSTTNTNPTLVLGTTNLVLLRIDAKSGPDDVYAWLNPAIGGAAPLVSSAFASSVGIDDVATSTNLGGFSIGVSNSALAYFDEIRIGTSFEEVTPVVPEPATASLLGLAAASLLGRRRR